MWKQNWTPCSCNEFLSQYQRAFSASEDLCNLLLAFTSMLGFIPPLQQRGQSNHIPVWITHASCLVFLLSHFCPCHKHRANIPFDIWSKYSHSSTSDQSSSTQYEYDEHQTQPQQSTEFGGKALNPKGWQESWQGTAWRGYFSAVKHGVTFQECFQ